MWTYGCTVSKNNIIDIERRLSIISHNAWLFEKYKKISRKTSCSIFLCVSSAFLLFVKGRFFGIKIKMQCDNLLLPGELYESENHQTQRERKRVSHSNNNNDDGDDSCVVSYLYPICMMESIYSDYCLTFHKSRLFVSLNHPRTFTHSCHPYREIQIHFDFWVNLHLFRLIGWFISL